MKWATGNRDRHFSADIAFTKGIALPICAIFALSENPMRKTKVARAVSPNIGRRAEYRKRLSRLLRRIEREALKEIEGYLSDIGYLVPVVERAHDASLTNWKKVIDPKDRESLERIMMRVSASAKSNPDLLRNAVEKFIALNLPRWLDGTEKAGKMIVEWYARNLSADITHAQAMALKSAGISTEWLKKRWQVPTVSRRYIPKSLSPTLGNAVQENIDLITRTASEDLARIQEAYTEGILSGNEADALRDALENTEGFSEARIRRIVIDQTNKLNNVVQTENCKSLGIDEGIWVHVPGQYTSRPSHIEMNGTRFKLSEGCYDPAEGRKVQCGELYYCRCIFRMVLPEELTAGEL